MANLMRDSFVHFNVETRRSCDRSLNHNRSSELFVLKCKEKSK